MEIRIKSVLRPYKAQGHVRKMMLLQPGGGIRYDDLVQAGGDEPVCRDSDVETTVAEVVEGFFCSWEDWDLPIEVVGNGFCVDLQKCLTVPDGPAPRRSPGCRCPVLESTPREY